MTDPAKPSDGGLASPPVKLSTRSWADLLPRAASAVVLVAGALAIALQGGPVFALFWIVAGLAVLWEWQHMIGGDGALWRFGVGAISITAAVALAESGALGWALLMLAAGVAGTAIVASSTLRLMAGSGVLYAGVPVISLVVLRSSSPGGFKAVLWLFAVVWGTDIMAYFGGRLVGGPKLWRRVSPAKTWSGFLIGIAAGALAGLAVGLLVKPLVVSVGPCVLIGLMAGALAQGGDLFESALKRRYGVKDASRIIPGHGGVMDRLDGFIAAAVFAAVLGIARFGVEGAAAGLFTW